MIVFMRTITRSPGVKWLPLFLVLLPLAWTPKLPSPNSNDLFPADPLGDCPFALLGQQFVLLIGRVGTFLPREGTPARREALSIFDLAYRGPPLP